MNPPEEPVVTTIRSGSTVAAVGVAIVPGDPRAQRRDAERCGIVDRARAPARPALPRCAVRGAGSAG